MEAFQWFCQQRATNPVVGQFYIVFFQTLGTPNAFTSDFPALYQSPSGGVGIMCDIAAAYAAAAITLPYTFHIISTNIVTTSPFPPFVNQFTRESVPNPISHTFLGPGNIAAGEQIVTVTVGTDGLLSMVYSR